MDCDVLIIGGGVIGVCAAYYLGRDGRSVILIDKGEVGGAASHGNAGWIAVGGHNVPLATKGALTQGMRWLVDRGSPFYIKPRLDLGLLRWLWCFQRAANEQQMRRGTAQLVELHLQSMALFNEIVAHEGLGCHFEQKGLLHLYLKESTFEKGVKDAKFLKPFGIETKILDRTGIQAMEPTVRDEVEYGIYYPAPASLLPGAFVRQLAQVVEGQGTAVHPHTELLDFEVKGGRVTAVQTTKGRITANEVVLAAGAWSVPIAKKLGIDIVMQPAKGYSITAKRSGTTPSMPLSLDDDKIAATPMGELFRFSSTLELAGFDDGINGRRLNATRKGITHYLHGMEELEIVEIWRGFRPTSPDGLPMMGRSHKLENLIIATGHGMLGITQGPISGKLVAQLVGKWSTAVDLTPFDPVRF